MGGRGKGGGRKEGEERGSHKFNKVSHLHCLQQLLWPRSQVGDNCTQVVMVTVEPHTLTLNRTRSATLLGGEREEEEGGREEGERRRRRERRREGERRERGRRRERRREGERRERGGGSVGEDVKWVGHMSGCEGGYEGVCVTGYWCKKEK